MSSAAAGGLPGMPNDVWPMVHAERQALIEDVEDLDDASEFGRRHGAGGQGPEISGPALALLLAVTGRRVVLDELGGPGLAILAETI